MLDLLQDAILGLSLAAPIGPVTIAVIKRGLNNRLLDGLYIWLGALTADATYLLFIYFGLIAFINVPAIRMLLAIVGTVVLLYLGYASIREYFSKEKVEEAVEKGRGAFWTGYMINFSNPMTLVWWVGIYGATISNYDSAISKGAAMLNGAMIIFGAFLWFFVLAALLHFGKRFVNDKSMRTISLLAGITLFGFGLLAGYRTILLFA